MKPTEMSVPAGNFSWIALTLFESPATPLMAHSHRSLPLHFPKGTEMWLKNFHKFLHLYSTLPPTFCLKCKSNSSTTLSQNLPVNTSLSPKCFFIQLYSSLAIRPFPHLFISKFHLKTLAILCRQLQAIVIPRYPFYYEQWLSGSKIHWPSLVLTWPGFSVPSHITAWYFKSERKEQKERERETNRGGGI